MGSYLRSRRVRGEQRQDYLNIEQERLAIEKKVFRDDAWHRPSKAVRVAPVEKRLELFTHCIMTERKADKQGNIHGRTSFPTLT